MVVADTFDNLGTVPKNRRWHHRTVFTVDPHKPAVTEMFCQLIPLPPTDMETDWRPLEDQPPAPTLLAVP